MLFPAFEAVEAQLLRNQPVHFGAIIHTMKTYHNHRVYFCTNDQLFSSKIPPPSIACNALLARLRVRHRDNYRQHVKGVQNAL